MTRYEARKRMINKLWHYREILEKYINIEGIKIYLLDSLIDFYDTVLILDEGLNIYSYLFGEIILALMYTLVRINDLMKQYLMVYFQLSFIKNCSFIFDNMIPESTKKVLYEIILLNLATQAISWLILN
jgi:hypothetical protein